MVGFYPDVPDNQIAYDLNGSIGAIVANGVPTQLSNADLRLMNSEHATGPFIESGQSISIILSEQTNISGQSLVSGNQYFGIPTMQWSANTTNGVDGTWTTYLAPSSWTPSPYNYSVNKPGHRINIAALSILGARALRITALGTNLAVAWHIYGTPVILSNQLALWHPTNDARVSGPYFDFGDVTRGYTYAKQFRIKNTATQTANDTVVSLDVLTDANPTLVGQIQFSIDGVTYSNTINIPTLTPSEISPVLYARYIPTIISQLSLWSGRIKAVATTWT